MSSSKTLALQITDADTTCRGVSITFFDNESLASASVEGLAIQRMLTFAQHSSMLTFVWSDRATRAVSASPAEYPLAAVAIALKNAVHVKDAGAIPRPFDVEKIREQILKHRLKLDMVSERQILLCLDHEKPSLPSDLYDPSSKRLRRDDEFEAFVDDLLFAQHGVGLNPAHLSKFRLPIAVILRELLENTDDHARTDLDGSVIKPNAMRGLLVKRIMQQRQVPTQRRRSRAAPRSKGRARGCNRMIPCARRCANRRR